MNKEQKSHIKKMQTRAILRLIATLLTIISIGFGILFLAYLSSSAVVFFAIFVFCLAYLIQSSRIVKKEAKENIYEPIVFHANRNISFEEIVGVFEKLTDKDNQLSTSENVKFFRLKKTFRLRAVLYRTADFNKQEFYNAKNRINKKANKELSISHWISLVESRKMMRFNIIHTDKLNDELYQLISQNACRSLTRVEGIINIVIIGNQIMIPPIYGECQLAEINRYKGVIKFINQVLKNS